MVESDKSIDYIIVDPSGPQDTKMQLVDDRIVVTLMLDIIPALPYGGIYLDGELY